MNHRRDLKLLVATFKINEEGLLGGLNPVVENPPCSAGYVGLNPGRGTKVSHAK